jgi:5-methylcytosine-specific restriction endonuclease McrA
MLAPPCPRCGDRHLVELRCWNGRHVDRMRRAVLATYGETCVHCGRPGATSVEHVQPRSWCGTDALDNLRPAHLACNMSRGTDPMPGWRLPAVVATRSDRW